MGPYLLEMAATIELVASTWKDVLPTRRRHQCQSRLSSQNMAVLLRCACDTYIHCNPTRTQMKTHARAHVHTNTTRFYLKQDGIAPKSCQWAPSIVGPRKTSGKGSKLLLLAGLNIPPQHCAILPAGVHRAWH